MVGALFGFQFLIGLYLQLVAGFGAAATGLAFLPITVAIGAFSLAIAPRLLVRAVGRGGRTAADRHRVGTTRQDPGRTVLPDRHSPGDAGDGSRRAA